MPAKVVKLELHPLRPKDKSVLDRAFEEAGILTRIAHRYFSGVLPARESHELMPEDIDTISRATKAHVFLPYDTFLEIVKRVYTNFEVAGRVFGTRPRRAETVIPVRVSKVTKKGVGYRRNLQLCETKSGDKSILFATISLGSRYRKRSAICFIGGGEGRPFDEIRQAMAGRGIYLGDPSTIVRRTGRYFLHLSITRDTPEPAGNPRRILGVDLGISGPAAAMFAIEVRGRGKAKLRWGDYTLVGSKSVSSGEFRDAWFSLLKKRARRMSGAMRTGRGARKGQRFSQLTRLGTPLHAERSRQFVYRVVNEVLDTAQELGCSAVAFEDLRSFRALLHGLRLYRKSLGYAYLAAQKAKETEKASQLLRRMREVKRQIKLLQALSWGRFRDDLQVEAKWRGIRTVAVRAAGTSVTCPRCRDSSKENRKGRSFRCTKCGFQMQVDLLAALNIAVRGAEKLLEEEKKSK
jgi:hypothetical protein